MEAIGALRIYIFTIEPALVISSYKSELKLDNLIKDPLILPVKLALVITKSRSTRIAHEGKVMIHLKWISNILD